MDLISAGEKGVENIGSLTAGAYERLRLDILSCRHKPGEKLRIASLSEDLAVSLGAVREGLSRLVSEGLVLAEPQRGFRVTPISASELKDLTTARVQIENTCFERSIRNGGLQWEADVVGTYHQLSRTQERSTEEPRAVTDAWVRVHARYHHALVAACDSRWLLRLRELLFSQWERYLRLSIPLALYDRDANADHKELMDAALSRDIERAAELLTTHIEHTTRILLDSIADLPDKEPASM
jgi:DNA-binding GntR family transcriptional regulator